MQRGCQSPQREQKYVKTYFHTSFFVVKNELWVANFQSRGVKSGIVTHKNGIIGIFDKGAIGPRSPVEGQIGPDENFLDD